MRERTKNENVRLDEMRLLDAKQGCQYLNIGMNSFRDLAERAGARKKLGKRILFDRIKIDSYVSTLDE